MGKRKSGQPKFERQRRSLENIMARNIDDLADYDEYRATIVPQVRKMLQAGATSKEILEKFKPYVTARLVNTALIGEPGFAISAAKEVLDRVDGKVTTTLDLKHKYDSLSEEQLDAIINSKLQKQSSTSAPTKLPPSSSDDDQVE